MRTFLRRWLGITSLTHEDRTDEIAAQIAALRARVLDLEDETSLYSGSTCKPRGVKEHVWALIDYLGLRPDETYEVFPRTIEEETKRRFKLVPLTSKKPE